MTINYNLIKKLLAIVVIICLIIFITKTDFELVLSQIKSIGYGFFMVLLMSLGGHVLGTMAWRLCFPNNNKISFWKLFYVRIIGENITLLNPTNIIGGEASKYHLLKTEDISHDEKIGSIILSRVLLITSQILIALFCIGWIISFKSVGIGVIVSVLILVVILFLIERTPKKISFSNLWLQIWISKLQQIINKSYLFIKDHPKQVSIAFVISLLHWACGAGEIYIILTQLHINTLFLDSLAIDTGVVIIKSIGGFVPGQIGIEEAANKWMLVLAGITSASLWITVSIIRRGKQLFWIVVSALLYFIKSNHFITKKTSHGHTIYNT